MTATPDAPADSTVPLPPKNNRPVLITLFVIVLVDLCGYTIVLPLLPFYAERLGASPFVVGSIVSLFALSQMISGPILGRLSDRYGRRPILIISQIGTFASFLVLAQAKALWVIYLARVIDGLTAGNITVAQAYVADVTSKKERTRAMGFIGAAFGIGFVLGPSLSAFFSGYSPEAPIWAASVLSAASILGSFIFLKDSRKHLAEEPVKGPTKRPPFFSVFRDENLRGPFLAFFCFSMAFSLLISGLALFAERVLTWHGLPFGQREVGWIFTMGGAIGLVIQTVLIGPAIRRATEKVVAAIAFAAMTLGFVLIGASHLLALFLVGYALIQGGSSFIRPTINGLISKNAQPGGQGFIFGVTQTLMALTQIIAPLISGMLIEGGYNSLWAWLSGVMALIGFFMISSAKVVER